MWNLTRTCRIMLDLFKYCRVLQSLVESCSILQNLAKSFGWKFTKNNKCNLVGTNIEALKVWIKIVFLNFYSWITIFDLKHTMHIFINSATSYLLLFLLVFLHGHHAFQVSALQTHQIKVLLLHPKLAKCEQDEVEWTSLQFV